MGPAVPRHMRSGLGRWEKGQRGGLSPPGRVPLASAAMPTSVEAGGSGCTSGEDTGVLRTAGEV